MLTGAHARGPDRHGAGLRLGRLNEVLDGPIRPIRVAHDEKWDVSHGRYECEVVDRIVAECAVERGRNQMGRGDQQKGVTIWLAARDLFGRDIAARADARFGDDRLAEPLGHLGAEYAGDDIGIASRRKALNKPDGPGRILLCAGHLRGQ